MKRFAALAPWLDDDLQKFYLSLLRSEARHYQDYLDLAQKIALEENERGKEAQTSVKKVVSQKNE